MEGPNRATQMQLEIFHALCTLAAEDGRREALFGDCEPLAREAFLRSPSGGMFPLLWFEVPLAGQPRFDLHVALSRESLQGCTQFFPDAETVGPNAVQGLQAEGFEVTGNPRTGLEMAPSAQSATAFQGIGQKGNFPLQDGFLYHKFPIHGADGVTLPLGCRRDGQAGA